MRRFFFDTEFFEDGKTIDLISIGIVCEDGREFYAVSNEARLDLVNDWVRANVLPQLPPRDDPAWMSRSDIRSAVLDFVRTDEGKPEFWAYYSAYDWVVFAQLFGTMMQLPKGMPMYCMDIKQLCKMKGDPRLPEQGKGEHNALSDARWNLMAYQFLSEVCRA